MASVSIIVSNKSRLIISMLLPSYSLFCDQYAKDRGMYIHLTEFVLRDTYWSEMQNSNTPPGCRQ